MNIILHRCGVSVILATLHKRRDLLTYVPSKVTKVHYNYRVNATTATMIMSLSPSQYLYTLTSSPYYSDL